MAVCILKAIRVQTYCKLLYNRSQINHSRCQLEFDFWHFVAHITTDLRRSAVYDNGDLKKEGIEEGVLLPQGNGLDPSKS